MPSHMRSSDPTPRQGSSSQGAPRSRASREPQTVSKPIPARPQRQGVSRLRSEDAVQPPLSAGPGHAGAPKAQKKRNPSQILSTVLIVVGVGLLLVAAGMWGFAQFRYWKQGQITGELQSKAIVSEATDTKPYPEIDWAALKEVNADVCAWIYVPDTVINYPIYQGVDNDQYLRTTATGEWSVGGQLFLDYESTKPGMVDHQSIVYGHHMLDGTFFEPFAQLEDQAKFDAMPTIWYLTEDNAYELEPLLLYYTVPTDTEVRKFRFGNDAEFRSYLSGLLERAVTKRADAAQIIGGAKHVVTMSTCNYYDEWGRTILVAIPKSEAAAALDGTTAAQEAAAAQAAAQEQPAPAEGGEEGSTEEGQVSEEYVETEA